MRNFLNGVGIVVSIFVVVFLVFLGVNMIYKAECKKFATNNPRLDVTYSFTSDCKVKANGYWIDSFDFKNQGVLRKRAEKSGLLK